MVVKSRDNSPFEAELKAFLELPMPTVGENREAQAILHTPTDKRTVGDLRRALSLIDKYTRQRGGRGGAS
jgi:hypothetical protein